jgi:hypothetical protein
MMNVRTRRTTLIISIGTALALAFSFVPTPAHGATTVHKLNYEGEVSCPESNPIKGMTYDARSSHISTQCYTQFYWDANMMGGEVFMEFDAIIRANLIPDEVLTRRVAEAVSDWKAERIAIDSLRDDAQRRAQIAADASPGDVICKAWSYTSRYNGSGGGSVCAVNNNPVDVTVRKSTEVFTASATKTITRDSKAIRYFAKTNKIPNLSGFATKLTFPKAPKGTKIKIKKSTGKLYPITSGVAMNAVDHPFGGGRGKRIKSKIIQRFASPGQKVGLLRPRRTGKKN